MTPAEYGAWFETIRLKKGWTQKQMADHLSKNGVPMSTRFGVSHLETRGTQKYSIITVYQQLQADLDREPVCTA